MLKNKIIAVDFDGTLCENKWPEIGEPNKEVISYLKEQKEAGTKIILWTCRTGKLLDAAVLWCDKYHQLQFDMVNRNIQEAVKEFGEDTRKVFADEYIDDKMCNSFKLPYVKLTKGITDEVITKLERVFNFSLYEWQKQYLKGDDTAMPTGGRGNGKTFAHCIRLLLEDPWAKPLFDLSSPFEINKLVDQDHGPRYKNFFRDYLRDLNDQLLSAGFTTNAKKPKTYSLGSEDLKAIENFLTKNNSVMEFNEMQAVVKMQYDLYRRSMMPTHIIHQNIYGGKDGR